MAYLQKHQQHGLAAGFLSLNSQMSDKDEWMFREGFQAV
jgi:hypothetical protein